MTKRGFLVACIMVSMVCLAEAQLIPSEDENIPFLVTFGNEAELSYGDDDFSQTFFFKVPKDYKRPVFIRIFDPDVGGLHDEIIGSTNTTTRFALYGGKGAYSHKDSKSIDPVGQYRIGNLIFSKEFAENKTYDGKWYTLGPFNPGAGEFVEEFDAYVFKLIADGESGDDGNLYRYFLSSSPSKNESIESGNAFTFEYSVRLHDEPKEVSHIYPFVDENVVAVKQHNFDWDNDGVIVIYSKIKVAEKVVTSRDGDWKESIHQIQEEEKGSCLDFQLIKSKVGAYHNNNVVFYVTNQYGKLMPFFSVPIGVFTPSNKTIKVE